MKNFLLLIAGAILLVFLSLICFENKLQPIKDYLISATNVKLSKHQIDGISVEVVGSGYKTEFATKLSGMVINKEEKQKALSLARDVDAVFYVKDNLTVEQPKIIKKRLVFEPVELEPQKAETNMTETNNTETNNTETNMTETNMTEMKTDELEQLLEENIEEKKVESKKTKLPVLSCQEKLNKLLSKSKIHFESAKSDIKDDSFILLDKIANVLKECKGSIQKVVIEGYTDSSGNKKSNLLLSQKRADAVKEYLISKEKIDKNLLKAQGFGQANPIADNTTDEGKRKNRRIEFKLKGGDKQ